jgi:hypothetical protein
MAKSKKRGKKQGVYCIQIKAQSRCMRKYKDGRTAFLKSGNIECPSSCRKTPKKRTKR